jgi:hypothetical protein
LAKRRASRRYGTSFPWFINGERGNEKAQRSAGLWDLVAKGGIEPGVRFCPAGEIRKKAQRSAGLRDLVVENLHLKNQHLKAIRIF